MFMTLEARIEEPSNADTPKLAPWTRLLRKGVTFVVIADMVDKFNGIKQALMRAPVLRYPDFTRQFVLTTDASGVAVGAVLSQVENGEDRPVAYASRKLTDAETRYPAIERELLGVVWGVQQFRPYLWGRRFKVRTDHKPLVWVDRGAENVVADCLSRLINATSMEDPQDASEGPEPFALCHLREWAESGLDLEVGEPAVLRHLRE
ncbi:hypothetical protein AAG570_003666 [Ranatra chinensis]|uniref:Reverse transcriptase/retrotransposon-derived protein RNase H-like domain-containing protein n=1 Tax=Ranatra chinensis TaxID=642074 RepID=A0ABD0Y4B2_9HEMI